MRQFIAAHRRSLNGLGFLACAVLLAGAYYLEFVSGMEPCPLCIFQRMAIAGVGVGFLIAFVHGPGRVGAAIYSVVIGLAALVGVALAVRHLWLQSLPEDEVPACGPGLDYMMDVLPLQSVIRQVLAGSGECAEVDLLLGVTLPVWTLGAFILLGTWGLLVNLARSRR